MGIYALSLISQKEALQTELQTQYEFSSRTTRPKEAWVRLHFPLSDIKKYQRPLEIVVLHKGQHERLTLMPQRNKGEAGEVY